VYNVHKILYLTRRHELLVTAYMINSPAWASISENN